MKIIDLHIGRAILTSTFASMMVLVTLSGLIRLVDQLKSIGRGDYTMMDVLQFVLYTAPRDIEIFFPMAALLGGLLGMGALASNSELIVMQASGWSKFDIIKSAMKTTTILVVLVLIIGEWVAPKFENEAYQMRRAKITQGSVIAGSQGVWAKDGNHFVHIEEVNENGELKDLTVYEFADNLQLERVLHADSAQYSNNRWSLDSVDVTHLGQNQISTSQQDKDLWVSSLTPDKLGIVSVTPEALSISELSDYLDYLLANDQDGSRYQLAFWRKLFQPITVAVMMLMALSFVFGPLRSTSMGARILMGVVIGFGFHITNRVFGPISLVYDLPAIVGALMPSILFTVIAAYLIKRQG
ncbi:LPS export ABC transporter permease LptG [Catenovulum sp. SM1970]|uniref:LPS export ABC transporter permease LptG n=1 Tax=Marinifaba aquimaris TaxID=2741323 RepID=UPI0015727BF0|nr:LPS export ABC transporter permease LptG [Marinifaba aquimaris]